MQLALTKKHIQVNDNGRAMDMPSLLTEMRLLLDDEQVPERRPQLTLFSGALATAYKPVGLFRAAGGAAGKNPATEMFDMRSPLRSVRSRGT